MHLETVHVLATSGVLSNGCLTDDEALIYARVELVSENYSGSGYGDVSFLKHIEYKIQVFDIIKCVWRTYLRRPSILRVQELGVRNDENLLSRLLCRLVEELVGVLGQVQEL